MLVPITVRIREDQNREVRLVLAALRDKGTKLSLSEFIQKLIDEFLEKIEPTK